MITSDNRKRYAPVVAVTVTLLALTGCGSGTDGATSSNTAASSSVEPSTTVAKEQLDQDALHILDYVTQGDFDSATAIFDEKLQESLTPQAMSATWDQYQRQFGPYQSHGDPQDVPRGDLTVVNVPLAMATMPGEFRVTFHNGDGTVAGIDFLETGVPVP